MTPFARFALVFAAIVLALYALCHGPFAGLGLVGGLVGATFGVIASIVGTLFGLACGALGLLVGAVAMIPFLIPAIILLSPVILFVALIAVAARAARS